MPWLVTPDGRPLHPSGLGREDHGQGGHKGQCSSGGRWLPGAGGAAHPAAQGTFTGQQADNGPGKGLIAMPRPSPSSAGRRTVSPWAPPAVHHGRLLPRRFLQRFLPRPCGLPVRRSQRKSLAGWPLQRHVRRGPGKQRRDVCGLKSGNWAPVGAGRAHFCLSEPIVRRAHVHTRLTRN